MLSIRPSLTSLCPTYHSSSSPFIAAVPYIERLLPSSLYPSAARFFLEGPNQPSIGVWRLEYGLRVTGYSSLVPALFLCLASLHSSATSPRARVVAEAKKKGKNDRPFYFPAPVDSSRPCSVSLFRSSQLFISPKTTRPRTSRQQSQDRPRDLPSYPSSIDSLDEATIPHQNSTHSCRELRYQRQY